MTVILVTGSSGLIGTHVCALLDAAGIAYRPFDISNDPAQDTRDHAALKAALDGVTGVVHLAAISRVVWAENDPATCRATNVDALQAIVDHGLSGTRPWLIFASSREVYGHPTSLPVAETAPLVPINVYGRSKIDGENIVERAREAGLVANICRFSSVFGWTGDHVDRVAMAFAGAAARGGTMHVEGSDHRFDFTVVDEVARGVLALIERTAAGTLLPPIHFVSGRGTTLRELANIAASFAQAPVEIIETPPRNFDVSYFVGDTGRAAELLGWRATAELETHMGRLVADLAALS